MRAIGLTEDAYDHLNQDDIDLLEDSLPSECEVSDEVNNSGDELVYVCNLDETVYKGFLIFDND